MKMAHTPIFKHKPTHFNTHPHSQISICLRHWHHISFIIGDSLHTRGRLCRQYLACYQIFGYVKYNKFYFLCVLFYKMWLHCQMYFR
jgi:hypothetical protein